MENLKVAIIPVTPLMQNSCVIWNENTKNAAVTDPGGDLDKIKSCIKLTGFVNSTENFTDQPKVINGASDLIALIFGEAGVHTRAAVSTNSLPLGVSVEVDAIFELE